MSNICRLCLRKEDNIMKDNIFDLHLPDMFYWIYGVEVDVDDPFSKLICRRCQNITNHIVRVRKLFQTNQYILKEKRCPLDYDVEVGTITKDASTSTENNYSADRILISIDTLADLSQPVVKIRKLEDTNINEEYQRISQYGFKKRKVSQRKKVGEPGRVYGTRNISNTFPSSSLATPRSESIVTYDRTESLNSLDAATNTTPKSRPVLISRATNTARVTKAANPAVASKNIENTTLISGNIMRQLFSPKLGIRRLEDTNICEHYEKIDDVTYRLKPPQLESHWDREETKRLSYMDYYYKIPTSALKELIIERQNEMNNDKNSIATNNCRVKEVSPLRPQDVPLAVVCKMCKQTFKTEDMLQIHYHLKHKAAAPKPTKQLASRKVTSGPGPSQPVQNGSSRPRKIDDLISSFDHTKFSNKQLWLDGTPQTEPSKVHLKPRTVSNGNQVAEDEADKKNPLRSFRKISKLSNIKTPRITVRDLPKEPKKRSSMLDGGPPNIINSAAFEDFEYKCKFGRPSSSRRSDPGEDSISIRLNGYKSGTAKKNPPGSATVRELLATMDRSPATSRHSPIILIVSDDDEPVPSSSARGTEHENPSTGAPKLSPVTASCPEEKSSNAPVQPEIVWFPETMGNCEEDQVFLLTDDDDSSSDSENTSTLRNKLTTALSLPMLPEKFRMEDDAMIFIAQRLCDIKKTRVELESMKKIRSALREEIETATAVDEKYKFIMSLLAK